jgi:hypothetical protein
MSLILSTFNKDSVLGQNKIQNYFLFYFIAIIGGISLILLANFLYENFKMNIIFNYILSFFNYITNNALSILGTYVFLIILVEQFLEYFNFSNPILGFILKLIGIIILTYFFIVPFLNKKLYFIFGKQNPNNNIK